MILLFPSNFFFSNKCSLQGGWRRSILHSFWEYAKNGSVFGIGLWSSFALKLFNCFTYIYWVWTIIQFLITQSLHSFSLSSTGTLLLPTCLCQCFSFFPTDLLKIIHKHEWQDIYQNVGNVPIVTSPRKIPGSPWVTINWPGPQWWIRLNQPLPQAWWMRKGPRIP